MEPSLLDDGELWLPPEFLTDVGFLVEEGNKVFKGVGNFDEFGFGKDGGPKLLFPKEPRSGFGSLAVDSGLGSPVESLVGSTEAESDEENYIAGLTRQMAHSTLEEDFSGRFGGNHNLPADNNTKGWSQPGSPQSTLCAAGISCCCRRRVPSPAAVDLYSAAAEEMYRIKISEEPYGLNHGGRGVPGQPVEPYKNPNIRSGFYHRSSLHYQKLQAIQFQQQQMMKHRQVMQNRGRVGGNSNGRPVGLSPSAWPDLQHAQPTGKRASTGTGVFLPRRVPAETQKKQTLSTVLVPARVTKALNLNLDDSAAQPMVRPRFESLADLNDASLRFRSSNNGGFSGQKRGGIRAEQTVASNELRLPSDWSY